MLSPERQSAWMSKIKNVGITRSLYRTLYTHMTFLFRENLDGQTGRQTDGQTDRVQYLMRPSRGRTAL